MPTKLPRLLLIAPHWPPDVGAAAARLSGLARELRAIGHDVRVIAAEDEQPGPSGRSAREWSAREPEVDVVRVPVGRRRAGRAGYFTWQARLAWRLRRATARELVVRRPDVITAPSPPASVGLAAAGLRDARDRRVPVVLDLRDLWPDVLIDAGVLGAGSPVAAVLRLLERRSLAGASLVTTVTGEKVERLRRRGAHPVALVTNAVDPEWLAGAVHEGGMDAGVFEACHAGNVGLAQDVGLLVRAVARLARARDGRPVIATVVGEGERLAAVQSLARSLAAPVTFVGREERAAVRSRLVAAGCAFVTLADAALTDAVPSKLLEAMGLGLPVVLAAAGESARLVREAGAGEVVAPGDVGGVADALSRLAGMSARARGEIGARGRAVVMERFGRQAAARALSRALVTLDEQARSPR